MHLENNPIFFFNIIKNYYIIYFNIITIIFYIFKGTTDVSIASIDEVITNVNTNVAKGSLLGWNASFKLSLFNNKCFRLLQIAIPNMNWDMSNHPNNSIGMGPLQLLAERSSSVC